MHRVADRVTSRVRSTITELTEWQRFGNQVDAPMIFARADIVKVLRACHCDIHITLSLPRGEQKRQDPPREASTNFISAVLCAVDSNCTDSCYWSGGVKRSRIRAVS